MTGRAKARHERFRRKGDWIRKNNPYKRPRLREVWIEGAQRFWSGGQTQDVGYLLNSYELAAYWKGYAAAEEAGLDD